MNIVNRNQLRVYCESLCGREHTALMHIVPKLKKFEAIQFVLLQNLLRNYRNF